MAFGVENIFRAGYFHGPVARFRDNLRRLQKSRDMSGRRLAEKTGFTESMISRWRNEDITPDSDTVVKLAAALGCTTDELLDERDLIGHTSTGQEAELLDRDIARGYKRGDIPLVGDAEASAGGAIAWSTEGIVMGQATQFYSRAFSDNDPRAVAFRIRGDSMVPRYNPGEVIIALPSRIARDSDFCVVVLKSGERLVKQIIRTDTGWKLHSLNPVHEDRRVEDADVVGLYPIKHAIRP